MPRALISITEEEIPTNFTAVIFTLCNKRPSETQTLMTAVEYDNHQKPMLTSPSQEFKVLLKAKLDALRAHLESYLDLRDSPA